MKTINNSSLENLILNVKTEMKNKYLPLTGGNLTGELQLIKRLKIYERANGRYNAIDSALDKYGESLEMHIGGTNPSENSYVSKIIISQSYRGGDSERDGKVEMVLDPASSTSDPTRYIFKWNGINIYDGNELQGVISEGFSNSRIDANYINYNMMQVGGNQRIEFIHSYFLTNGYKLFFVHIYLFDKSTTNSTKSRFYKFNTYTNFTINFPYSFSNTNYIMFYNFTPYSTKDLLVLKTETKNISKVNIQMGGSSWNDGNFTLYQNSLNGILTGEQDTPLDLIFYGK